jgi:hypothetical protein
MANKPWSRFTARERDGTNRRGTAQWDHSISEMGQIRPSWSIRCRGSIHPDSFRVRPDAGNGRVAPLPDFTIDAASCSPTPFLDRRRRPPPRGA